MTRQEAETRSEELRREVHEAEERYRQHRLYMRGERARWEAEERAALKAAKPKRRSLEERYYAAVAAAQGNPLTFDGV